MWSELSREVSRVARESLLSSFGVFILSWSVREDVGCFAGSSLLNRAPSFSFDSESGLTTLSISFSRGGGFSLLFFPLSLLLILSGIFLCSSGGSAGHGWTR